MIDSGGWPAGLVAAVLVGVLLWPIGGRLGLRPASRAAATALYASAALLIEMSAPSGVDGQAALMLAIAACLAIGNAVRNVVAVLACAVSALLAPVAAVGFLVLLGAMAVTGGLGGRLPARWRWAAGCASVGAAAGVLVVLARPGLPLELHPIALSVLTLWALLVTGLLWRRLRWLRPVGAAALALVISAWTPGPDADAVILVVPVLALLTVVLAEEFRAALAQRVLAAGVAAASVTAVLLGPSPIAAGPPALVAPAAVVRAPADLAPPGTPESAPAAPAAAVRPLSIAIPALGVSGPLGRLTADPATGELSAPDDPSTAGWFAAGVVPGDVGPAVVGGHVDSRLGPGVFSGLGRLQPGDVVDIARSDGRTVRFAVTAVRQFPKDRFPTEAVYGAAPAPELRLVTCGGPFDRAARSYEDNIVVDAVLD